MVDNKMPTHVQFFLFNGCFFLQKRAARFHQSAPDWIKILKISWGRPPYNPPMGGDNPLPYLTIGMILVSNAISKEVKQATSKNFWRSTKTDFKELGS